MISKSFIAEYDFGQILYLKTDTEQIPRICTGWLVDGNNVLYRIESGTDKSTVYSYAVELSTERDLTLKME